MTTTRLRQCGNNRGITFTTFPNSTHGRYHINYSYDSTRIRERRPGDRIWFKEYFHFTPSTVYIIFYGWIVSKKIKPPNGDSCDVAKANIDVWNRYVYRSWCEYLSKCDVVYDQSGSYGKNNTWLFVDCVRLSHLARPWYTFGIIIGNCYFSIYSFLFNYFNIRIRYIFYSAINDFTNSQVVIVILIVIATRKKGFFFTFIQTNYGFYIFESLQ